MTSAGSTGLSRRGLLGALAAGGAAAMTGCSVSTGGSSGSGAGPSGAPTAMAFPDYPTKMTTQDVTFRWIDSGDLKSVFEQAALDAFTKKHPNIKTNYDGGGWSEVNQVVPLGVRNHNAPDVFALPQGTPAATAVNQGWVHALDDIVPDFDAWKAAFPATAFIPGVHIFNGKTYSWPLSSDKRLGSFFIYDKKNMASAGYDDPAAQIKTWDDLHAALKKVVKQGKVGLMLGQDNLAQMVTILAQTAGWVGIDGVDYRSGQYTYGDPTVLQAFEFLQKLATDKLLVPGFMTLKAADARSQMSAGRAGVLLDGPWDIPKWKKESPDWEYLMGTIPSPTGKQYIVPFQSTGANNPWVYADSKLATAAGQIMGYMGSAEGQKMMVILSEGNLVSLLDKANKAANQTNILDKNAERAASFANEVMREAPIVAIRNPDSSKVDLVRKQVQPVWMDLMEGIFAGKIKDPKKTFADYDTKQSASLDEAIATAKKTSRSTITRDDYKFPNWDPSKAYTLADYKALPGYKG